MKKHKLKFRLVLSDEDCPKVELKPDMKFEVQEIELIETNKGDIKKLGARLCGGTHTCLALIDIESRASNIS